MHSARNHVDKLIFEDLRETLANIEARAQGNTAYTCLICKKVITRRESYQSWRAGWAHGKCIREENAKR